jgi:hypothetical protein
VGADSVDAEDGDIDDGLAVGDPVYVNVGEYDVGTWVGVSVDSMEGMMVDGDVVGPSVVGPMLGTLDGCQLEVGELVNTGVG